MPLLHRVTIPYPQANQLTLQNYTLSDERRSRHLGRRSRHRENTARQSAFQACAKGGVTIPKLVLRRIRRPAPLSASTLPLRTAWRLKTATRSAGRNRDRYVLSRLIRDHCGFPNPCAVSQAAGILRQQEPKIYFGTIRR